MSPDTVPAALEAVAALDLLSEGTSRYITSAKYRLGGGQVLYAFPNGRGGSVIRHHGSYGAAAGLFELAVLGPDGRLDYSTEITDDVIGHLTPPDVEALLVRIMRLAPER